MKLRLIDYLLLYLTMSFSVFIVAWYGAAESTWGYGIFKIFFYSLVLYLILYYVFFRPRFNKMKQEKRNEEKQNERYSDL